MNGPTRYLNRHPAAVRHDRLVLLHLVKGLGALALVLALLAGPAPAMGQTVLIKQDGQYVECEALRDNPGGCDQWGVDWRDEGGEVWGAAFRSSRAALQRHIESRRNIRLFGTTDWQNPSPIYCASGCPGQERGEGDLSADERRALSSARRWSNQYRKELQSQVATVAGLSQITRLAAGDTRGVLDELIPRSRVSPVFGSYVNSLAHAYEQLGQLQRIAGALEHRTETIADAVDQVNTQVRGLRSSVRDVNSARRQLSFDAQAFLDELTPNPNHQIVAMGNGADVVMYARERHPLEGYFKGLHQRGRYRIEATISYEEYSPGTGWAVQMAEIDSAVDTRISRRRSFQALRDRSRLGSERIRNVRYDLRVQRIE